jgi:uncharacterized protein (UPF0548 family)
MYNHGKFSSGVELGQTRKKYENALFHLKAWKEQHIFFICKPNAASKYACKRQSRNVLSECVRMLITDCRMLTQNNFEPYKHNHGKSARRAHDRQATPN